jgi:hypothetical protein
MHDSRSILTSGRSPQTVCELSKLARKKKQIFNLEQNFLHGFFLMREFAISTRKFIPVRKVATPFW